MVSPPLEQIQQLAQKLVESEGLDLIDLEFKAGKSRNLLRIFIDKAGGVSLADCENISRQLGTLLDVQDLLKQAYVLEVSSPGVDRPLRTDRDYERSLGRLLQVQVQAEDGKVETVTGTLLQVNSAEINLDVSGESMVISRDRVLRARQEIPLPAHPKKNKKRR